jgi:protein-arginine kinase activator protein McsA
VGKSPLKGKTENKPGRPNMDLGNLKADMQRAIQREDFEEAARLRDQIKKISSQVE